MLGLRCGAWASHRGVSSCCRARALGVWASVVVAHELSSCGLWALERRLSSCGARAQLLRGMWDLPGLGLEPVSPALAGGFLTTTPLGKPSTFSLIVKMYPSLFSGLRSLAARLNLSQASCANKLTLYPSLYLTLNFFCAETKEPELQ